MEAREGPSAGHCRPPGEEVEGATWRECSQRAVQVPEVRPPSTLLGSFRWWFQKRSKVTTLSCSLLPPLFHFTLSSISLALLLTATSEQTHFTFIMYLNDDFEGGETIIFPEGNTGVHGKERREEVRVRPARGMALVFRHSGPDHPLHSGAPHTTLGKKKYVLRTDIMYLLDEE